MAVGVLRIEIAKDGEGNKRRAGLKGLLRTLNT